MKKTFYLFFLTASLACMSGCEKDETAGVSRLVDVTEPGIILKGEDLIILPTGNPYTDQGAIGIDSLSGNKQTDLTPLNLPDVMVPGLYPLTYRTKDANGFTAEAVRNVFVFDSTLTEGYTLVTNEDLSGTYVHNSLGRIVTVVQASPGLYICNDLYGTTTPTPLYFLNTTEGLVVPAQPTYTGLGDIQGTGTIEYTDQGKYILNFSELERIGVGPRPRKLTQQ